MLKKLMQPATLTAIGLTIFGVLTFQATTGFTAYSALAFGLGSGVYAFKTLFR